MTRTETAQLLTMIAAYDRRTIGDADVIAWHDLLTDARFTDAKQAVSRHYSASRQWMMPVELLDGIKAIRSERLKRAEGKFVYAGDPDDPAEYRRQLAEHRQRVADGADVPPDPEPNERLQKAVIGAIQNTFRRVPPVRITQERTHP